MLIFLLLAYSTFARFIMQLRPRVFPHCKQQSYLVFSKLLIEGIFFD